MWRFQRWNYLPSPYSIEGWCLPQQYESKGNCRVCPSTDIHGGSFFSWPGGPLQEVHQRICMYCTALSEYFTGEGASMKLEWVFLTKDAMEAFKALRQACMTAPILVFADYTNLSCWRLMHPRMDGGGVVTEPGRWVVPPHYLWQQSLNTSWKELSINQTWVFGIKMGSYRAL